MNKFAATLMVFTVIVTGCLPALDAVGEIVGEAATQPSTAAEVELSPNVFTALRGGPLVDENQGSCITSDFSLRPQPFRVGGAPFRVGGAPFRVGGADGDMLVDDSALQPSFVSNVLSELVSVVPVRDTAIVVLDDFGQDVFRLGRAMFEVDDLTPETLIQFEGEGVSSHGALVMNHINAILEGLPAYEATLLSPGAVEYRHEAGPRLVVKAVAPADFETGAVAQALGTALTELRADGIENIVVNMSFVILPCSIVKDFVEQKIIYPSLFNYLGNIVQQNVSEIMRRQGVPSFLRDEIAGRVSDLVLDALKPVDPEGDPLRLVMLAEPEVLFVGAAGNFGRAVAAYPAVWNEVLAVSASDPDTKADFSNTGSVMLAGAWFRLVNPYGLNGHDLERANVVYAGTSFAAPGVSVFAALDLASDARCGLLEGHPRLGYDGRPDLDLATAVTERCLPAN